MNSVGTRVRLSVIVVNWNSRSDLEACLQSLVAQTHPDLEVIVIDNGSTDGSGAMVRDRFGQFALVEAGENLGFAEGCNRGIARATGPWIALLNNDAVADRDWASALVVAAESAPRDCGMLQSAMFFLDRPDTINSMGLFLTRSGGAIDRLEGEPRKPVDDVAIFCPTGGAAAYRRTMLDAIALPTGWLDREYFMYSEDFDLGWRAQLAGFSARLVSKSIVLHKFHGSTRRRGRAWFVSMTRTNRLRTLIKNASPRFLLRTAPHTAYEICELFWHGGLSAGFSLPKAIAESVRQRRHVSRLSTVARKSIEARWVGLR
ncbi:glycosyltransferase family 2 protein [soil metagenome]